MALAILGDSPALRQTKEHIRLGGRVIALKYGGRQGTRLRNSRSQGRYRSLVRTCPGFKIADEVKAAVGAATGGGPTQSIPPGQAEKLVRMTIIGFQDPTNP